MLLEFSALSEPKPLAPSCPHALHLAGEGPTGAQHSWTKAGWVHSLDTGGKKQRKMGVGLPVKISGNWGVGVAALLRGVLHTTGVHLGKTGASRGKARLYELSVIGFLSATKDL